LNGSNQLDLIEFFKLKEQSQMDEVKLGISEAVLARAASDVAVRPTGDTANFYRIKEQDEVTGQIYWFFLKTQQNEPMMHSMPTGVRGMGGRGAGGGYRGEQFGDIEIGGLMFVVFKVYPLGIDKKENNTTHD
jgi:hypothetical protein